MSQMRSRTLWSTQLIDVARQLMPYLITPDLHAAFLFGSAAWGDADPASDLDIMLLLNRPAGYREVTRVRPAELFGTHLPDGPHFADLDRISVDTFCDIVGKGGWGQRVVHSVVLADTDDWYAQLRTQVSTSYFAPAARQMRFAQKRARVEAHRAVLREALHEDGDLAALHGWLALDEAALALLQIANERVSLSHNVERVQDVLGQLNQPHLFATWCHLLGLNVGPTGVVQSIEAYHTFAHALQTWMADPALAPHFSIEDRAWAALTSSTETLDEISRKVTVCEQSNRLSALQYYLDGLMLVTVSIPVGKVLQFWVSGTASRMMVPDFHGALHAYPQLYDAWITALRLRSLRGQLQQADALAGEFLQIGERALKALDTSLTTDG